MKLYVDDLRPIPPGWIFARGFEEAMRILASGKITYLSLDHDLGQGEGKEGYDILKIMEKAVAERKFKPPQVIIVHSDNAGARKKMEQAIESIKNLVRIEKVRNWAKEGKK